MVSESVSENFGIEKSIGFSIENIWYRKKHRIRYRRNLVSEKKFRIRFRSDFGYRHTLAGEEGQKNALFSIMCMYVLYWAILCTTLYKV